jgi:hypothetical protein
VLGAWISSRNGLDLRPVLAWEECLSLAGLLVVAAMISVLPSLHPWRVPAGTLLREA